MKANMALLTYKYDSKDFSWSLLYDSEKELDDWLDNRLASGAYYKDIKLFVGSSRSEYSVNRVWKREIIESNVTITVEKYIPEI